MSWQLASYGLLGLALAAGFGWYERTRPDARIVALVATLAALAALGRIAFAALPNVKPSTDIVLIAGYALGPAPGFVVGALTGLVSNFFFGQGPWTVWQMAAWGATGVIGAGLAAVTGRRIGRWPLALVCAVVGFAFTAFQDVGDWVTYSDHSAGQLGIYVGKGVGFDLVHATGCLLFALAFGPALARSLARFTQRLQVRWIDATALPVLLAAAALAAGVLATDTTARAATTPEGYLEAAQNADGGFGPGPGSASSPLFSGWAALGLAAEGVNPEEVRRGGASVLAYIASALAASGDPGSLERTILVVRAAGENPAAFAGRNLLAALEHDLGPAGAVSGQVNLTAFAVLALHASGVAVPGRTLAWLERQQDGDGGFGYATAGSGSDVDDTGAALEALAGVPGAARARARAVAYIRAAQNRDGGLPSQPGGPSNAQSTAWAAQGLLAAGVAPASLHRDGAPSPLSYLGSLIGADGHVSYARGDDETPVWVTAEALMALAGRPLPLAPVPIPAVPRSAARAPAAVAPAAARLAAKPRSAPPAHALPPPRRAVGPAAHGLPLAPGPLLGALTADERAAIMDALARVLAPVGLQVPNVE